MNVQTIPFPVRFLAFLLLFAALLCALSLWSKKEADPSSVLLPSAPERITEVVLDAGHGGEDGGAEVEGVLEKDINLSIARKTADILRLSGYRVKEVRTEDISVYSDDSETLREKKVSDLNNRVRMFNEDADAVAVSIHQNKYDNSKYHGAQLFYSTNDPDSADLARAIRTSVVMLLQNDNTRELKPAGKDIFILKNAEVPAVIVECGFLSNAEERQKLTDETYQQEIAYAIAMGVIDYQNQKNSK